jgi:hypothetical protein
MESNSNSNSTIEQWKAIAAYHKAQLEFAEKKVQELMAVKPEPQPEVKAPEVAPEVKAPEAPKEAPKPEFTEAMLKAKVLGLWKVKKWKTAVEEDNLIDNVKSILEECRMQLMDEDNYELDDLSEPAVDLKMKAIGERLGKKDSDAWRQFVFQVIQKLKKDGSFDDEGRVDTFEDTAGGCDEMTWHTAVELLKATPIPKAPKAPKKTAAKK